MTDELREPIGKVLPGFTLHPLDAGCTPSQAFVLIKTVDQDGVSAWSFRTSQQLNLEELLGALIVQVDLMRRRLVSEWETDDE